MSYLALGEKLDPDKYVIAEYRIESDLPLEIAAQKLAEEESTGTWTDITTTNSKIIEKLGAKVTYVNYVNKETGDVVIGYPIDDFSLDIGGIPQILSVVAGNFFGLEELKNARLNDVHFPKEIVKQFKGPKFGRDKVLQMMGCDNSPAIGGIVKPKIGLSPEKYGEVVYLFGIGGLTAGKDDETLVNQSFCPLLDRVVHVREAIDKVKEETGRQMLYSINITTRCDKILEVADLAIEHGANQLLVDVVTCGFTAVQALAEDPSINVPIHCHRAMHAAFTRNPKHGVDMIVLAKLCRLAGGDSLHVGTWGVGKMHGDMKNSARYAEAITKPLHHLKPVLPIASGGLHPGSVELLLKRAGFKIQVQAGGGVAGHPDGVLAGAKAMRQAVDAVVKGIPLEEYAKTHKELKIALEKWGVVRE
ncbi:MAG: RuBisCO large subunit C-terminal-like domain-containing protein [Candidatus Odinarchaeia archaeon]